MVVYSLFVQPLIGKCVIIDHGNGMQTLYAHQNKIHVTKGMKIARGQQIGNTENTVNSTGLHLHFEVIVNGNKVDPMKGYLSVP